MDSPQTILGQCPVCQGKGKLTFGANARPERCEQCRGTKRVPYISVPKFEHEMYHDAAMEYFSISTKLEHVDPNISPDNARTLLLELRKRVRETEGYPHE